MPPSVEQCRSRVDSPYGSTWEGTIVIRDSRWIPTCGTAAAQPNTIGARNDGQLDLGYRCFIPREIIIDGLVIDDRNPTGKVN